jgi:hypothetical protein
VQAYAQPHTAFDQWGVRSGGRSGFGTKLVISSLSDQLGGTILASWPPTGAVITLKTSEARLGA